MEFGVRLVSQFLSATSAIWVSELVITTLGLITTPNPITIRHPFIIRLPISVLVMHAGMDTVDTHAGMVVITVMGTDPNPDTDTETNPGMIVDTATTMGGSVVSPIAVAAPIAVATLIAVATVMAVTAATIIRVTDRLCSRDMPKLQTMRG